QDLSVFWDQLDGVLNSAGFQSRLSDVARLDYTVGQNLLSRDLTKSAEMQEVGVAIFEGMACLVYDCLDWRRQHEHYLNTMRLINIPNIYTPVHNIPPDAPTEV
ncbi:sperm-associated antigen 17 isoform X3, partial [Silurus meridionalis]